MAKISTVTDSTMFQIKRWLGLNEAEDGDSHIKLGEASQMRNWSVTKNGSLQIRKGTKLLRKFGSMVDDEWVGTEIQGMWFGYLYNANHFVVASGGKVYDVAYQTIIETNDYTNLHEHECAVTQLTGSVSSTNHVEFFPYQGFLYIMDGVNYQKWDGNSAGITAVSGYVPTILTGCNCSDGSGTSAEQTNLLTSKRILKYTVKAEDIVSNELTINFQERPKASTTVIVKDLVNGHTYVSTSDPATTEYTVLTETIDSHLYYKGLKIMNGATIPTGPNVISVEYELDTSYSSEVKKMRFYEYYNGANNNRVFLYGNGTNICIYSGLTEDGQPTAEYFPAMNQIQVGESNAPITAMIRHYSKLVCYKTSSTYTISYETMTLDDGNVIAGFYMNPVNREIGNQAPGQVRLVSNNPYSLYNGNVYMWKSTSRNGQLTFDERQAQSVSEKVEETLKSFAFAETYCFDYNYDSELYICCDDKVLVLNYGSGAWYLYTNLKVKCITEINHVLYFGMEDGSVRQFTYDVHNDYREPAEYEIFDGTNALQNAQDGKTKYIFYDTEHLIEGQPTQKYYNCYVIDGVPYKSSDGAEAIDANSPVVVNDGIDAIDAYWKSGSLSFDRDWKRKYSMMLWIGVMPEVNSRFTITAKTDKRPTYPEKMIVYGTAGFAAIDFSNFSFGAFSFAQMKRVKMKIKKYVFCQLIFESISKENTATVTSTDILVRYAANTK